MSQSWGQAVVVMFLCGFLRAQSPPPNSAQRQAPTVTFTFDWASIQPHHYVISLDNSGSGSYESLTDQPVETPGEPPKADPYALKFTVSPATRDRVFSLARQLNYFNGDFEFHKSRVAATGEKVLAYADASQHHETRYNFSENPGIEELTLLFQGISATVESGRRLSFLHRFDKLGLNEELKNLEHLATQEFARELEIIAPTLQQIAEDASVMHIARERARHLLQRAAGRE
jgi:hypothetical protein